MKKLGTLLVLFLSIIGLAACASGKKDTASTNQKLKVVATNSIIADITKNIAGDKIDLHSIVPVGQDPHEYEPLPEDVKKTSEADLIFYNGINLETGGNAWFTKLVENAKKTENKDYFAVSDSVDIIYLEGQNEKGKEDPHAWLNLENGMIYAKNIAKQLIAKDPSNKEFYEKNLKEYTEKLDKSTPWPPPPAGRATPPTSSTPTAAWPICVSAGCATSPPPSAKTPFASCAWRALPPACPTFTSPAPPLPCCAKWSAGAKPPTSCPSASGRNSHAASCKPPRTA